MLLLQLPAQIEDCVVVTGVITHTKSNSNAMTTGPELEKAEPSRRFSGGPCTMKAQDILFMDDLVVDVTEKI